MSIKQKKKILKTSLVFGDILHNNFSIGYILCNMKSSSCIQPFTEYMPSFKVLSIELFSVCSPQVLELSF